MAARPEEAQRTAEFWEALRRFLRRNEQVARKHDLTPQRHQLLVMIQGAADGTQRSTVTELAHRLHLAQSTVTELVDRAERAGLVARESSSSDGRVSHISLTEDGRRRMGRVMAELRSDRATLESVLAALAEHQRSGELGED
ncbi:MAG TPA: MarR family transcriptional regulator [Gaiellales bacterium]|nr:MarR family transcriptional regulator [Gaiellales bacterium]